MPKVWTFAADVTELRREENYRRIYEEMPEFRKEKADRLRQAEDKALSVGAWKLWMLVKEKMTGVEASAQDQEKRQDRGQRQECDSWKFNLSHSGRYVLCSVTAQDERVGCDVEMIRQYREPLARRFFCPSEYERMTAQTEPERTETFYRYWVLKESFMKATRRGMSLGLAAFEIEMGEQGETPRLIRQPEDISEKYYFHEYTAPDARIAVCSTSADFAEETEWLSLLR